MCERFTNTHERDDLVERFGARQVDGFSEKYTRFKRGTNPEHRGGGRAGSGAGTSRMRWGLIPHWAKKDPKNAYKMINARAETLLEKPAFRVSSTGHAT